MNHEIYDELEQMFVLFWLKRQLRRFTDRQIILIEAGTETTSRARLLSQAYGAGLIKASELVYFNQRNVESEFNSIIDELALNHLILQDGNPNSQLGFLPADNDVNEEARKTRK